MSYTPDQFILATPFAELAPLIQDGIVQQTIKNSLQQNLVFGMEFEERDPWMLNLGQTTSIPRDAPMPVNDEPRSPDVASTYKARKFEETSASVSVYGDAIKLNLLQAAATIKGFVANSMNTLGRNAQNTLNAVRRKSLYSGYLGGHAVALVSVVGGTSLRVSSISGFKKQLNSDGKWLDVSSANPKPIVISTGTYALVTGVAADDAENFPDGRGTLTLSAVATWDINDAVVAMDAPYRIYQGTGTTVDAISGTDILTLDSLRQALALHEENGIQPHSDGTYWVHLGPRVKPQLWADPEFQNVLKGAVSSQQFGGYELTKAMGCTFINNQQVPTRNNASSMQNSRLSTTAAKLSKSIYGEIVNRNGIELGHTLVTGGGLGKTWFMPQGQLASAAGMNAQEYYGMKVTADNMSMMVEDMIRFLMLAPSDDNRQYMPANWQFIGSFMLWNDQFGGTYSANNDAAQTRNPYYKRAVAITHYAG